MIEIVVNYNPQQFEIDNNGDLCIKVSQEDGNRISVVNGILSVSGEGGGGGGGGSVIGGSTNVPGNGFYGIAKNPVGIIRLNNTVSRKVKGDPLPSNEGVYMPDIINKILGGGT